MLRTLKIALFITPLLFVLSSCLSYEEVKIVKFAGVEVKKMSAEGITVEVKIQINNPNNYKISIVNTNLMVSLNGADLGKAKMKGNLVLPKNSNEVHSITVTIKGSQLKAAMPTMLLGALGGGMQMNIKGTITARAKMLRKKIDVDLTDSVKL